MKLDVPLLPDEPEGLWQVGLRVSAVPEAPAFSLQAAMPSPNLQQFVFGEQFSSGRLRLGVRDEETGRRAVWRGSGENPFAIDLVYRVQLTRRDLEMPLRETGQKVPEAIAEFYSLEILRRLGVVSDETHAESLRNMIRRGASVREFSGQSTGAETARAVTLLSRIDRRIRERTEEQSNLDGVVAALVAERTVLDRESLLALVERTSGVDVSEILKSGPRSKPPKP